MKNPDGPPPKSGKSKPASKAKTPAKRKKRTADENEDDEDEEEPAKGPPSKRSRKAPNSKSKPKSKSKKEDEDEDEDGEGDDDDDEPASSGKSVPELLLANKWDFDTGLDPTGWWVSEKLDGVRYGFRLSYTLRGAEILPDSTFYDGKQFISRLGNPFTPPQWFLDSPSHISTSHQNNTNIFLELPKDVTLDGELYAGRGEFQSTVSIVKTINSIHWKNITFQVRLHLFHKKKTTSS